jgi:hypothetical protein
MPGIVGIIAFLTVLGLSLFITRLATIALTYNSNSARRIAAGIRHTATPCVNKKDIAPSSNAAKVLTNASRVRLKESGSKNTGLTLFTVEVGRTTFRVNNAESYPI